MRFRQEPGRFSFMAGVCPLQKVVVKIGVLELRRRVAATGPDNRCSTPLEFRSITNPRQLRDSAP